MKIWKLIFTVGIFLLLPEANGKAYTLTRASGSSDWSSSTTVDVKSGELFQLSRIYGYLNGSFQSYNAAFDITIEGVTYNTFRNNLSAIYGPCIVSFENTSTSARYIEYQITVPEIETSPMNIISLPEDNNGDVELLVESSTDLQSWTPVYSGSAGTSNNAAFFRTRLIAQ